MIYMAHELYHNKAVIFLKTNNEYKVEQGIWDWLWEGTLLTNGRWDGPQKSCYSLTLFTSGTPGPSCPRDRVSQGPEAPVSGPPVPEFPLLPAATPSPALPSSSVASLQAGSLIRGG